MNFRTKQNAGREREISKTLCPQRNWWKSEQATHFVDEGHQFCLASHSMGRTLSNLFDEPRPYLVMGAKGASLALRKDSTASEPAPEQFSLHRLRKCSGPTHTTGAQVGNRPNHSAASHRPAVHGDGSHFSRIRRQNSGHKSRKLSDGDRRTANVAQFAHGAFATPGLSIR